MTLRSSNSTRLYHDGYHRIEGGGGTGGGKGLAVCFEGGGDGSGRVTWRCSISSTDPPGTGTSVPMT